MFACLRACSFVDLCMNGWLVGCLVCLLGGWVGGIGRLVGRSFGCVFA